MTEQEIANLRWMIHCNDDYDCGFLGPTVKRFGRLPEVEPLVRAGLAECRNEWSIKARGYFITAAGRAAVSRS